MLAALKFEIPATDLAEYLVRKSILFRKIQHIAGTVVAPAEKEGKLPDKLTIEQLQGIDSRFGGDVLDVFGYERSVEMKSATGGTSKSAVMGQIKILKDMVKGT